MCIRDTQSPSGSKEQLPLSCGRQTGKRGSQGGPREKDECLPFPSNNAVEEGKTPLPTAKPALRIQPPFVQHLQSAGH